MKELVPLQPTCDEATLLHELDYNEVYKIRPILGAPTYQYLYASLSNPQENPEYMALLAVIEPALAWQALLTALPLLQWSITPTGIRHLGGKDSVLPDESQFDALYQGISAKAAYYLSEVKDYLLTHPNDFPDWLPPAPPEPEPPFSFGLFVPGWG